MKMYGITSKHRMTGDKRLVYSDTNEKFQDIYLTYSKERAIIKLNTMRSLYGKVYKYNLIETF